MALSFAAQMRSIAILLLLVAASASAQQPVLRWGGDAEGGAPSVEADPNDPAIVRGLDVEVAEQIAKGLGRRPEFHQVEFTDIDQSVQRGDFDIGLNGVEDTPARRRMLAATIPYFEFHEVLTMRIEDRGKFSTLAALRGRRVGTLGGTIAYERVLAAEKSDGQLRVTPSLFSVVLHATLCPPHFEPWPNKREVGVRPALGVVAGQTASRRSATRGCQLCTRAKNSNL